MSPVDTELTHVRPMSRVNPMGHFNYCLFNFIKGTPEHGPLIVSSAHAGGHQASEFIHKITLQLRLGRYPAHRWSL